MYSPYHVARYIICSLTHFSLYYCVMVIQEHLEELKLNVSGSDPTRHELALCNKEARMFRSPTKSICYRVCDYVESYIHTSFHAVILNQTKGPYEERLTDDRASQFVQTNIQSVPLATEPGIFLIILTPTKIFQRNLNRSTFVV
jgi:hypothetical protein